MTLKGKQCPRNFHINEDLLYVQRPKFIEKENIIEPPTVAYMPINSLSGFVRASWHHGNDRIFTSEYSGAQRVEMALTNIVRVFIIPPSTWDNNILNAT